MARIEILVEEPSMKEVLSVILPKILPTNWVLDENYFIRSHEGKSDLQKSIPQKIKVFSKYHEPAGIIILQDQDSNDCKILKNKLKEICFQNGDCKVLIRIVCKELESWYLGDMQAIKEAYPNFKIDKYINKKKFREPDIMNNAAEEVEKILPEFKKINSAKLISQYLDVVDGLKNKNKSESYKQFIKGVENFFEQFS